MTDYQDICKQTIEVDHKIHKFYEDLIGKENKTVAILYIASRLNAIKLENQLRLDYRVSDEVMKKMDRIAKDIFDSIVILRDVMDKDLV